MALTARLAALIVSVLTVSAVALAERAGSVPPLVNWSAPATYSPSRSSKIRALTDISSPVPFITTAPCRQYNSLLASPLLQGVNRAVTLTGAPCNIPAGAVAVSVNITVFNISGATGNGVFKVDTVTPPAVAWINYPPSEAQRGNAGVVALNGSGQIIVQVAQGAGQVDFIVDTNGYYASAAANQSNSFFYTVSGVRKTHKDLKPIGPGNEFVPRSADARMPAYLTEGQKAMLISNGTYKQDGTVNMETAERAGWVNAWADREAATQAAAREAQNAAKSRLR